jgi:hypothetical protein
MVAGLTYLLTSLYKYSLFFSIQLALHLQIGLHILHGTSNHISRILCLHEHILYNGNKYVLSVHLLILGYRHCPEFHLMLVRLSLNSLVQGCCLERLICTMWYSLSKLFGCNLTSSSNEDLSLTELKQPATVQG